MADQPVMAPSVPDLLVELMRQQAEGFAEGRRAMDDLGTTVNRMDTDVALVKQNIEQLNGLPARVAHLETMREVQKQTLQDFERRITANSGHVADLLTDTNRRKGVEGPLGKLGLILAGTILTILVGALLMAIGVRPAKGAVTATPHSVEASQ